MIRRFGATGLLLAPAAWVATEYARAHVFGGFPWIPLGNAVVTLLPLAQVASLVGVYGLSWLLALLHACFALAAVTDRHARVCGRDRRCSGAGGGAVALGRGAAAATTA